MLLDKAEYKHQWYLKNKEKVKAKAKSKYYSNHDAALERRHQYYLKNKDKELKAGRERNNRKYKTNPEWRKKHLQMHMDWYNNLPKSRKDELLRQMRERGDKLRKETKYQIMKLCGNGKIQCKNCGIKDIDVLTIDHINGRSGEAKKTNDKNLKYYGYSLWKKVLKGELNKSEYQTLCMNCNWKRHLNQLKTRKEILV